MKTKVTLRVEVQGHIIENFSVELFPELITLVSWCFLGDFLALKQRTELKLIFFTELSSIHT